MYVYIIYISIFIWAPGVEDSVGEHAEEVLAPETYMGIILKWVQYWPHAMAMFIVWVRLYIFHHFGTRNIGQLPYIRFPEECFRLIFWCSWEEAGSSRLRALFVSRTSSR